MIDRFKQLYVALSMKSYDSLAQHLIRPLTREQFVPWTTSALNAHSLTTVLNDIVINRRKSILEFGTGVSTLYLASLAEVRGVEMKIVSVDDSEDWLRIVADALSRCNLSRFVELVHAPRVSLQGEKIETWYDKDVLSVKLSGEQPVDLVLVDGPISKSESGLCRLESFRFCNAFLADRYSFYLDDCHRSGEKKCLSIWHKEFGAVFQKTNPVFAAYWKGSHFNPVAP